MCELEDVGFTDGLGLKNLSAARVTFASREDRSIPRPTSVFAVIIRLSEADADALNLMGAADFL